MSRYHTINPEELGAPQGFSQGLLGPVGGRTLFVAGQTAADTDGHIGDLDFVEQFGRALANIVTVVRASGGEPEDVGRLTIYVTEIDTYLHSRKALGQVYRGHMGRHFPAMALVEVSRLVDKEARVEIEATAILSSEAIPTASSADAT